MLPESKRSGGMRQALWQELQARRAAFDGNIQATGSKIEAFVRRSRPV
jgi:hypothetical protein